MYFKSDESEQIQINNIKFFGTRGDANVDFGEMKKNLLKHLATNKKSKNESNYNKINSENKNILYNSQKILNENANLKNLVTEKSKENLLLEQDREILKEKNILSFQVD